MDESTFLKTIKKAVEWLATEHNYFTDIQKDLQQLKTDLDKGKEKDQVKDIKKALGDFRYLGKSERRLNRYETAVEDVLEKLKQRVAGAEQLHDRLHAEASHLIRTSSFYEGKLRDHLLFLKEEIKDHEIEKAQAALMELFQIIEDTEKWLAALSTDLASAKNLAREFYEQHGVTIKKILDEIEAKHEVDQNTAKRLESAILQSNDRAEELQKHATRLGNIIFEIYSLDEPPEDIVNPNDFAFIIKIILQSLPWEITPKSLGKIELGGNVLEYYHLPQDDPRTVIVDIFWQNVADFGGLNNLTKAIKKQWTAVPEDEPFDVTKTGEDKSNCTALLVLVLRLREKGYSTKAIRFLIKEFARGFGYEPPSEAIISHNKILTIILETGLLTGITIAELGGGWYTTNFNSLAFYDAEGKDIRARIRPGENWNSKLWGEYIRHEPRGHQTVHGNERVTLDSYRQFFPKDVDFSLSSRVISLGSGMEYDRHSSTYCAFELLACFANITKKGGYSIQYADTVRDIVEYAPLLQLIGFELVETHGGNIYVYQKINNHKTSKREFDNWFNENLTELQKQLGKS